MPLAASDQTTFRFFAVCAPGLETLLARELNALGADASPVSGGVEGRAERAMLWRIHRDSALAESVRVRLKSFRATSFSALETGLAKLPWHAYAARGTGIELSVSCKQSRLYHSDAVAERVRRVLEQRLGAAAETGGGAPLRVFIRVERDIVTPSIDSSGQLLHRRGYRRAVEVAPLRETLAAAMVTLLDDLATAPTRGAWDPFCGSGVLPLEWLRTRLGIAPGAARRFAFEAWPTHPSEAYARWRGQQPSREREAPDVHAWASDVDDRAIQSTAANAAALLGSGADALLSSWQGDFGAAAAVVPEGTAMLCNPPHGKRIGSSQRSNELYTAFERLLVARRDLRPVVLACGHQPFVARALSERPGGLRWQRLARTKQGGLPLSILGLAG